jgi:hypothetical protein
MRRKRGETVKASHQSRRHFKMLTTSRSQSPSFHAAVRFWRTLRSILIGMGSQGHSSLKNRREFEQKAAKVTKGIRVITPGNVFPGIRSSKSRHQHQPNGNSTEAQKI